MYGIKDEKLNEKKRKLEEKSNEIQELERKREKLSIEKKEQSSLISKKLNEKEKEEKELKQYMKSTRENCLICLGKDKRECFCKKQISPLLINILLLYELRCRKGKIVNVPKIPKVILITKIYPYMKFVLLQQLFECHILKSWIESTTREKRVFGKELVNFCRETRNNVQEHKNILFKMTLSFFREEFTWKYFYWENKEEEEEKQMNSIDVLISDEEE